MRDVLDAVTADAAAAESRRAQMRERFPDFAAVMDSLGPDARMRHIEVDGVTVAGKKPADDPSIWCVISGEFAEAGMRMGWKR
jgi:hypothetical protein